MGVGRDHVSQPRFEPVATPDQKSAQIQSAGIDERPSLSPAPVANDVDDHAAALPMLLMLEREIDQLVAAQAAADQQAGDGAIAYGP